MAAWQRGKPNVPMSPTSSSAQISLGAGLLTAKKTCGLTIPNIKHDLKTPRENDLRGVEGFARMKLAVRL